MSRGTQALVALLICFAASATLRINDVAALLDDFSLDLSLASVLDEARQPDGTVEAPAEADMTDTAAIETASLGVTGAAPETIDASTIETGSAGQVAPRREAADRSSADLAAADLAAAALAQIDAERAAAPAPTPGEAARAATRLLEESRNARPGELTASAELLEALRRREAELEAFAQRLSERETELTAANRRLDERLAQLASAKEEFAALIATIDQAARRDVDHLVAMYERMKPKEAAPLFSAMAPNFAAGFLSRMRADKASAIVARMEPRRAYAVTLALAGRNVLPSQRAAALGTAPQN